jgi:cysteine synthase B
MGTTGTIMGVSTFLNEKSKSVSIVGAQPTDNSRIPGIRKWSPNYVPKFFDRSKLDAVVEVSEAEARAMTRRLAKEEGVFAGMSSGGAVASALKVAEKLESGVIVTVICDRGDRYLSSDLFQ